MTKIRLDVMKTPPLASPFQLTEPAEMHANPHHGVEPEASLVQKALQRFPPQLNWRPYPEALKKQVLIERLRHDLGHMWMTDDAFHRIHLHMARDAATERYVEHWHQIEHDEFRKHGDRVVAREDMMRILFFRKVREVMIARSKGLGTARSLQIKLFDLLRRHAIALGIKERAETLRLLKRAIAVHDTWLNWRLENLFVRVGKNNVAHLSARGRAMEVISGELAWELHREATQLVNQSRLDSRFVTLPNGGMHRAHHVRGETPEYLTAKLEAPIKERETRVFQNWHVNNAELVTINHVLAHANGRGELPEAASAALAQPKIDRVLQDINEWHATNLFIPIPNGGFARLRDVGNPSEKVMGDDMWAGKDEITHRTAVWHEGHRYALTANAIAAPLAQVGKSAEKISSDAAQPLRDKREGRALDWHKNHLFMPSANHVIVPLKARGTSFENVVGKLSDVPRRESHADTKAWREHHRFVVMGNSGFGVLPGAGKTFEKITSDVADEVQNCRTENLLERRLANLYAPTPNGGWRRLGRTGKSLEHVTAEQNARIERAQNETDVRLRSLETARARRSLEDLQRALSAHEQQTSALQAHVRGDPGMPDVKPDPKTPEAAPPMPAKAPRSRA